MHGPCSEFHLEISNRGNKAPYVPFLDPSRVILHSWKSRPAQVVDHINMMGFRQDMVRRFLSVLQQYRWYKVKKSVGAFFVSTTEDCIFCQCILYQSAKVGVFFLEVGIFLQRCILETCPIVVLPNQQLTKDNTTTAINQSAN